MNDNIQTTKTISEEQRPIWKIHIMYQRAEVNCYACDTTIIDTIKYYGSPIQYVFKKTLLLTRGQKLILEFLDRSQLEYERGWLLKLGYGVEKNDGPMTVFKQGMENENKYYLDAPVSIPEVPGFSIDAHVRELIDGESVYDIFKIYGNDTHAVQLAKESEFHQKTLNKKDLDLDSDEDDRGIRRTYKFISSEKDAVILNGINIE
jgi:hypothetical protein